jgi:hypothetical protein
MKHARRIGFIMAATLTACFASAPAIAQQDAAALNERVVELYRAGKFSEAIPLARQSLAIGEKALGPDHPSVATALNNLADLYWQQGATRMPSRCFRERWRSARKRAVATILVLPTRSTTLLSSTTTKVATPTPSRSTGEPWRSARKHSVPTMPPSPHRSTVWLCSTTAKVATPTLRRSTSVR